MRTPFQSSIESKYMAARTGQNTLHTSCHACTCVRKCTRPTFHREGGRVAVIPLPHIQGFHPEETLTKPRRNPEETPKKLFRSFHRGNQRNPKKPRVSQEFTRETFETWERVSWGFRCLETTGNPGNHWNHAESTERPGKHKGRRGSQIAQQAKHAVHTDG